MENDERVKRKKRKMIRGNKRGESLEGPVSTGPSFAS